MPPKFDVLQSQNNRKNCIKQLVERIEELSHVIQQKDQRILELYNFIGNIWTMAKGYPESAGLEASSSELEPSKHKRLPSISFKEDQRGKFALRSSASSAYISAPYSEEQLEAINCLLVARGDERSEPDSHEQTLEQLSSKANNSLQQNPLATTRATQP